MSHTTCTATAPCWSTLASKALAGDRLTLDEGVSVLQASDDEVLGILHAAFRVRRHYFGKRVKLNMLMNVKSGHCPEDCGYCSQSKVSSAPIQKYTMLDKASILAGAQEAIARQAGTFCIVASGRGPSAKMVDQVAEAVSEIKATSNLKICACLGILKPGQAEKLRAAGVDRYNHNLNTSANNYDKICQTHGYDHRVQTVEKAKAAGISPCSGVIVGMGETNEDIVQMAWALRELNADSIPVNFLHAIEGTPLEGHHDLTPQRCLKVLALFRFICPDKEIRASGGREVNLRALQPLALYAANALFVGDYLTTAGQEVAQTQQMIHDLGFEIEKNHFTGETFPAPAAKLPAPACHAPACHG